jgi:poly-gamma-glutamate synthesis protein (capsule biosynthesis protein)
MQINIAGDFFISHKIAIPDVLVKDVLHIFRDGDLNIVNLEGPVTKAVKEDRIKKTGPNLHANPYSIDVLKSLNVNLVTLANNHIMDYGQTGLDETLEKCRTVSLSTLGAGKNLQEASLPHFYEKEGIKIAILNIAENEWGIAAKNKAGANPLDIIENYRQIKAARQISDAVILIVHGGHEHYNLPSPRMVKLYHFYADAGASVVVSHHSHCISGYEMYQGVPIFYSLGNFLFTLKSMYSGWYTGLVLSLCIKKTGEISFNLLPVDQHPETFSLKTAEAKEQALIMEDVEKFSSIIADDSRLEANWNAYLSKVNKRYLSHFSAAGIISNRYIGAALRKSGIYKLLISKPTLRITLNLLRCESHLDTSKAILEAYLEKTHKS